MHDFFAHPYISFVSLKVETSSRKLCHITLCIIFQKVFEKNFMKLFSWKPYLLHKYIGVQIAIGTPNITLEALSLSNKTPSNWNTVLLYLSSSSVHVNNIILHIKKSLHWKHQKPQIRCLWVVCPSYVVFDNFDNLSKSSH